MVLRRGFQGTQRTFYKATVPLEYMARRSNLGVLRGCSHRRRLLHYYSLLLNHRKWHM
jgi:hypothetical protein